jgi:hypothetical protein
MDAVEPPLSDSSPPIAAGKGLVSEIWTEHRTIFKALLADALLFICVLSALLLCSGALRALARAGYEESRLALLETLHH